MPAFKKLGPDDQIDNVLVLEPQWTLASGSSGWKGSPEGSGSINLYGGPNRLVGGTIQSYQYSNLIPAARSYGALRRSNPITASVRFVYMTSEDRTLVERSDTRWGYEHWKTVQGLYDFYNRRDVDYTTASYDHYVLYFQRDSRNVVALSGNLIQPTGSFTIESWVKPFLTSSVSSDFTLHSRNNVLWLGVSGSDGHLAFSSSYGVVTASGGPTAGEWSHVALSYNATTLTGTFYLNMQSIGTFSMNALTASATTTLHSLGNRIDGWGASDEGPWSVGSLSASLHGFLGESRVWSTCRTLTELSGVYDTRLTGNVLASAEATLWFNEGPLGRIGDFSVGSGALDQARLANADPLPYADLRGFSDRFGPVWHPSDNARLYVPKTLITGSVSRMMVVTVPAGMYGRCLAPNSVRLTCNAFNDPGYGLSRTLVDDGRGGLYLSGSAIAASGSSVVWNKVGNVFYDEGLITIRDPALLDFAANWTDSATDSPNDLLQLSFRSHARIPVKTLVARIERGELNASLNPSYYTTQEDGFRSVRHPSASLYVTTVGLYNSDRELVGVARLAEPLRIRPRDRLAIKIRMDF